MSVRVDVIREDIYLDINEFNKGKTKASHGSFVFDEDDPSHSLCTFLAWTRRGQHGLVNCLRSRQRIKAPEEQHGTLRVSNVACAVIHIAPVQATFIMRSCTLRIVYFDPAAVMGNAGFKRFIKGSRRRGAVRCWRRHLNEGKERIHKCAGMFDACELGKAEALRRTL